MGANLILPAGSAAADSDPVTRSLRFAQGDSPRLVRSASSIGTSTNPHKITISMWFKMGDVAYSTSGRKNLLNATNGAGSDYFWIGINGDNKLNVTVNDGSLGIQGQYITNRVFRDPTAWMHLCVAVDSELAAEADRCKIFINGVRETSFSTTNHWPEDWDNEFNEGTYDQYISGWNNAGSDGTGSPALFFDGLIADVYNIDGAAIEPVGNFIEDTGYNSYKPKAFDMSSYGGNSFHLKFENSADIGADSSGNSNGFDYSYGISGTTDQLLDTPNKNYAALSPLDPTGSDNTLSEANLKCVVSTQNTSEESTATIGISSGKWYWEQYVVSTTSSDGGYLKVGVKSDTGSKYWHIRGSDGETESDTGSGASNGSSSVSYDTTNIVGVAVDMDAGKWWVSVDGTFVGSPTADTGELHSGLSGTVLPYVLNASSGGAHTIVCNFGQDPTFAGNKTSGQDTSQSEFYYAPPSGFKALCSANFDNPTVKAHENFGVLTYTGNDTDDTSITGLDFQPNFTWIKQRSNSSTSHFLHDSERTQGDPTSLWNYLKANDDANESWDSDQFDGFLTNGFKVSSNGNSDDINKASRTYVAWNWKENDSAGFDIVTWTGDQGSSGSGYSEQSVSHSLGVAPEMMIAKARTDNALSSNYYLEDWAVYHKDLSSDYFLNLNLTSAQAQHDGSLFSSIGASSVSFGNDGYAYQYLNYADYYTSAEDYVAYLFASVDGVCKVGSYTGNGAADGPMVHCGFRPAFVMVKRVSNSDGWVMHDNARDPDNGVQLLLQADSSADELGSGTDSMDFLATGFKLKVASTARNNSAEKYIFLAMAESPLKYANAR